MSSFETMARSLTDALLQAGVVRADDTPAARQERAWRERQAERAREVAARMAEAELPPAWEGAATPAEAVDSAGSDGGARLTVCADCAEPFDPESPEHRPHGRADQCGPCARGEAPGPRRKRGQMVWTHKTAPTLEIEGGPRLSPEELAAMRRR
jgi:hypothetical protein